MIPLPGLHDGYTPQVTYENESLAFTPDGVWIQPLLSDGFWFSGSPAELMSILVYHTEIDITRARFYVRGGCDCGCGSVQQHQEY